MHTTNYTDTFIAVADDCPVQQAEAPAHKAEAPSVAAMQFALLNGRPYAHTSDDVAFIVHAHRTGLPRGEWATGRARYFSQGRPCLRTSPLAKRYGFGLHCDGAGRVALVPKGSPEYDAFINDGRLTQLKAMRSKRA
ncbi:MAG: DUF6157 family protein [Flavobacteriales bacterium]|jgi:hypothetical protein|nr:DUF6157 family protein [Flavobacteriales bacterium]